MPPGDEQLSNGPISHLIFDCDGVLVDSEIIAVEVESRVLTEAGFAITIDEIVERYVGLSYGSMLEGLEEQFGRALPDGLLSTVQQLVRDEFPARLQPVRGIDAMLDRSVLPRAVASSSDLARIMQSLELTSLDRHFDDSLVLSAQMVENGKPEPDLFLLASAALDAEPRSCLVIEDSPPGVVAARRAGMSVVGFTAGEHATASLGARLREAGASHVVSSAPELEALLGS